MANPTRHLERQRVHFWPRTAVEWSCAAFLAPMAAYVALSLQPEIVPACTTEDLLTLGGLALVIWGIPYTVRQIRQQQEQLQNAVDAQRAELAKDLYSRLYSDPDIRAAYYLVEYDELPELIAIDRATEQKLDRLLAFADMVCAVERIGRLAEDDMSLFDYEFSRIAANGVVKQYMASLVGLYGWAGVERHAFADFQEYCKRKHFASVVNASQSKWEATWLRPNWKEFGQKLRKRLGTSLAAYIVQTLKPQLIGRLSRLACGAGDAGLNFYVDLVANIATIWRCRPNTNIVSVLEPFLEWDYGLDALRAGIDLIGPHQIVELSELDASRTVEVVWLTGLAFLASPEASQQMLQSLQDTTAHGPEARITSLSEFIEALGVSELGLHRPNGLKAHQLRLWQNAVAICLYRYRDRSLQTHPDSCLVNWDSWRKVLVQMLKCASTGADAWPLEHDENIKWQRKWRKHKWFWADEQRASEVHEAGVTIRFLTPLEVLNIGNVFSTCVRLGGEATAGLLGWSVNTNVRVVGVLDAHNKLLARRTIWLKTEEPVGVVTAPPYPGDTEHWERIEEFLATFVRGKSKLVPASGAHLPAVCVASYDDVWR